MPQNNDNNSKMPQGNQNQKPAAKPDMDQKKPQGNPGNQAGQGKQGTWQKPGAEGNETNVKPQSNRSGASDSENEVDDDDDRITQRSPSGGNEPQRK